MEPLRISTATALHLIEGTGIPAEVAIDQLLQALRAGDIKARAGKFHENKSDEYDRQVPLPAEFWDHAEPLSLTMSPMKLPNWCEWQGRKSPNGSIAVDISVPDLDVRRLWLADQAAAEGVKRGAKRKIDLEDILIQAACHVCDQGMPRSKADLVEHLLEHFDDRIGRSTMDAHVTRLWQAMKAADKRVSAL